MSNKLRSALSVIVLVAVAAGAFYLYGLWIRAREEGPPIGARAPEVLLEEMTGGGRVRLPRDLEGEAFAMVFFSYDCPKCREEALQLQYAKKNMPELRILIIAPATEDDVAFLTPTGHEVLLDRRFEAFAAYGITTVPRSFFIDRQGIIRDIHFGWTRDSYEKFVDTLQELAGVE
jgi:peroxiredoxin